MKLKKKSINRTQLKDQFLLPIQFAGPVENDTKLNKKDREKGKLPRTTEQRNHKTRQGLKNTSNGKNCS